MVETLLETLGVAGLRETPDRPASVVVDGTALDTSHRGRGIGRYVDGLLGGFAELADSDLRARLSGSDGSEGRPRDPIAVLRLGGKLHDWLGPDADREMAGTGLDDSALPRWTIRRPPVRHLYRWFINEAALTRELAAGGAEVYHTTEPWSLPTSPEFKTVATCHDVIPLEFPDHYLGPGHLQWSLYYGLLRRAERWKQCDRIIAISEATKRSIVEYLEVEPDDVAVVPNGIDHDAFSPVEDPEILDRVCRKYDLSRPFALYLGGYDYRKNVETLVRALPRLPDRANLVLAGGMWPDEEEKLRGVADELGVADRVDVVGYVDDSDLEALYSAAEVFAYPSLAEGFGLQVLEAMATGCPVVAGFATSLPEVVGDAGLLVNPSDPDELGEALARIFRDDTLREDLAERGRRRAAEFSWKRTAEETLEVYADLL